MIQIGKTIVSLDLFEQPFMCHLSECKGMCCVYGESGAPLEDDEISLLQHIYPRVKPYMTRKGIKVVEKEGVYVTDAEGDKVTPLIDTEDCVFAFTDGEIVRCAIEKAYHHGKTNFCKPISCHLYPIRITRYTEFDAVNYHQWSICREAVKKGQQSATPLYVFLKAPLIRKYGVEWYEQLCIAATEIKNQA
ncbi:MAG: DUF3109 family protein [Bacteroidales bacterium]|nr:DUF3109 family protein [Bacteroidales bacterium]